jgi:uncharacterized protein (DUF608 family)
MQPNTPLNPQWPVVCRYDQAHLARFAMPLGGIGTGTVSLGGRGQLLDWEVMNTPAKGYNGGQAFFTLWAQAEGAAPVARVLEGALQPPYEGAFGARDAQHGFPRMRRVGAAAAYPLAQVLLEDDAMPLQVRLEAVNPLVPADADASGWPVAVLRYVLINPGDRPVQAAICGTLNNVCGDAPGGPPAPAEVKRAAFRDEHGLRGLYMDVPGLPPDDAHAGSLALATTATEVSAWPTWPARNRWNGHLIAFWDAFSAAGALPPRTATPQDLPTGSLAARATVPAHGQAEITFILAWRFPNRQTWSPTPEGGCGCGEGECCPPATVGNYYATQFSDAWAAASAFAVQAEGLEARTVAFVGALCGSDLPPEVTEAALFNLSTLRSQTSFRTADGRFFGWEGCADGAGCCRGSCTHVWNYEQATTFLFGDLARSMRETEFLDATDDRGHMAFRVELPIARARDFGIAAADGQMGCILKVYREWLLSGDEAWLRRLWPRVRKAVEFCWIPGGWDADRDGVMEGCQHNTLDVEYYGPNPLMAGWYLGALRAAEELARHLGEAAFADTCAALYGRGRAWVDANLFNGEYYEQIVTPPTGAMAEGLRSQMGAEDLSDPDFQLGPGCLVDQLVGQCLAHICGLGHLLDPEHVRRTLASLMRYNWRESLHDQFNPMRTFALNDEQALLMITYPRGGRPRLPVPYYAEVMTGFEYTAAVHMLYEGLVEEGLRCIRAIRARYDGARRNPFDEAECGHHYARAMMSWGAVLALSGMSYEGAVGTLTFAPRIGRHFWSTGYAWGTCRVSEEGGHKCIALEVIEGRLPLARVSLGDWGTAELPGAVQLHGGQTVTLEVS